MQIIMRNPADLIPYDKNAKKHDEKQIKNVARSIEQYGFAQPVVIDTDNVIVIGHCRVLAALRLKLKEIPCVCADHLTPEQVNALRVVDNKSNESDWDMDILADIFADLDLDGFDFEFDLPDLTVNNSVSEDDAPEIDETSDPITKSGDIWILGRHRLMCGDSTSKENIHKLEIGRAHV